MGVFATVHFYIGLFPLILWSFFICLISRPILGQKITKRLQEYIVGQGIYYWMSLFRFWSLKIEGKYPADNQPYIIISNHLSKSFFFFFFCLFVCFFVFVLFFVCLFVFFVLFFCFVCLFVCLFLFLFLFVCFCLFVLFLFV